MMRSEAPSKLELLVDVEVTGGGFVLVQHGEHEIRLPATAIFQRHAGQRLQRRVWLMVEMVDPPTDR